MTFYKEKYLGSFLGLRKWQKIGLELLTGAWPTWKNGMAIETV
jgi:hypothetical protein